MKETGATFATRIGLDTDLPQDPDQDAGAVGGCAPSMVAALNTIWRATGLSEDPLQVRKLVLLWCGEGTSVSSPEKLATASGW